MQENATSATKFWYGRHSRAAGRAKEREGMEFRVLGPLEIVDGGRPIVLGAAKQRALLAILLLDANEIVSRDRLIDDLWGERPPAPSRKLILGYVSALRALLEPEAQRGSERMLLTRPPGYVLCLEPDELDLT